MPRRVAAGLLIIAGGIYAASSQSAFTNTGPATESSVQDSTIADDQVPGSITASTIEPAPDTTATVPQVDDLEPMVTTIPVETSLSNQAEPDLRFDYGGIDSIQTVDGTNWIWFDRWSFGDQQNQGPNLVAEPRYELATDWHGGANVNPRLRSYVLAPDVRVLQIGPEVFELACGSEPYSGEVFIESDLPTLLAVGPSLVSLTFNSDGQVTLIRDQMGC